MEHKVHKEDVVVVVSNNSTFTKLCDLNKQGVVTHLFHSIDGEQVAQIMAVGGSILVGTRDLHIIEEEL